MSPLKDVAEQKFARNFSSKCHIESIKKKKTLEDFLGVERLQCLSEKALTLLPPFSSTCLCGTGFAGLIITKTNYGNRMDAMPTFFLEQILLQIIIG